MSIFIALGANQPARFEGKVLQPAQTFKHALNWLALGEVYLQKTSHLWQSQAWPDPQAQSPFSNAVIEVTTRLSPDQLLKTLKTGERKFGRKQTHKNAARPLDMDILDCRGQVMQTSTLTLPHPRMLGRAFVLMPLAEIAPNWRDPVKNRTIHDWIARLPLSSVELLNRLN